ncbi:uncharacterized protein BDW43DRAFT_257331 [Aspergillus alliaceus]|uniref:uncharacterized protein n=1 Tax=Petromyces alliaceus TaxID=209559 RepID=UPI0012A45A97|nr:uncharacterized protein BDW43DRAFT_257331 [Aspergillus alliaceus]KAB8227116.1 hypothetical protein BDW43DRAFT_257331 [Aspergillus alliaceus]
MNDAVIGSLCEQFVTRLKDNYSYNFNRHRFFRNGTVKKVFESNKQDLRELLCRLCQANGISLDLLPDIEQRTLKDLSIVFAILLFAHGRQEVRVLRQFLDLVLHTGTDDIAPLQFTDADLPVSLTTATATFPLRGAEFYQKQFRFCAVTLMKREEVIYKNERFQCPLPYLEQTKIGEGTFGQVWRVRIEQQHIQSRFDSTATTEALEYARKDFELNRAFEEEREVLNKILDQPRRHRNIMVALASLQYGSTYSLFFPLASCNLWEYLNGVGAEDRLPPSTWEEKGSIYGRGVTLAGALAFLHHEFRNQRLELYSCYHLDLKPHNILVFNAYTDSETWKITDFGLSRVKGRGLDGDEDVELVMPILRRAQKRARHLREPSTMNRRGEGTYLAPECSLPNGRVSSASDVWSFGCIISLVMTYIDFGHSGVVAFARERRRQDHGDSFYFIRHGKPKLSSVIAGWFDKLKGRARASPFAMEQEVVRRTLDFLQQGVLNPIRDRRVSSKEVEDTLTSIGHLFHRKPSEASLVPRSRWPRFRRPSISPAYTPHYKQLPIETSTPIHGSAFAPGGDILAFYSPHCIQVFFPDEILSAVEQAPRAKLITVPKASLECVASSSRFLCAGLATPHFECFFYEIVNSPEPPANSIAPGLRVYYPHMGSIKRSAMSADGLLTAFVITRSPGTPDSDTLLYLTTTQNLLGTASEGNSSIPSSRSNSAASYQDSDSITSGGNIISRESTIGPATQIRSLTFSNDNQYLIMVAQLDHGHLLVRAWDTFSGISCAHLKIGFSVCAYCFYGRGTMRLIMITIYKQGSSSVDDALYTACCGFNREPRLLILCQGKYLLVINSWRWEGEVHTLPHHPVNVFVRDDDEAIVLLGDNGSDRRLRTYTLPMPIPTSPKPMQVALSNLNYYRPALDSAVLTRTTSGQIQLIVATTKGQLLAIKVPDAA